MLVTFTTDASADITMFGDVAFAMLRMMGHSPTVPGAILAADVPVALSRLTAAIEAQKTEPSLVDDGVDDGADNVADDNDRGQLQVSMRKRGLPLVNLLAVAAKANSDVMWK